MCCGVFASAQELDILPKTKAEFNQLLDNAKKGSPLAQYQIACSYLYGVNGICTANSSKAKMWMQKAADNDNPDACRKLYRLDMQKYLAYGEKAKKLYLEMGTGYAYYCISDIYANNRKECRRWLKAAMNNGYKQSREDLLTLFNRESTSDSFDSWCAAIEDIKGLNKSDIVEDPVEQNNNKLLVNYDNEIDMYAPLNQQNNDNTLVLAIGNEHYKDVANVPYALNDAMIFARYCQKTLGVPEKNVIFLADGTFTDMKKAVKNISKKAAAKHGAATLLFYYAGHGLPDLKTSKPYMIPTDADGLDEEYCFAVSELIDNISSMQLSNAVCFFDACFSGDTRNNKMLADNGERGVKRDVKHDTPKGNMVIFSSASGDETAWPLKEKGHGLFTYYLLKKLQETKGNVSLGELGHYVIDKVSHESSFSDKMRPQTPTVVSSGTMSSSWKDLHLR